MNILITGANGQLGHCMQDLAPVHKGNTYYFTDVAELDITNREAVHQFVRSKQIDLIVNCAAYTNVDKAEEDEQTARLINALAVENLATAGARVIHVSTDYVFAGDACVPYNEEDTPNPKTAYGRTKLEGEQLLLKHCPNAIIFRTAWLYSPYGNNFVKTMIRLGKEKDELGVVFDQVGTPTSAYTLANAIFTAICCPEWHPGIYHLTDEGVCSWFDFTVAIHSYYNTLCKANGKDGIACLVKPILSSEYAYKTPRPHYSVLDKSKYKRTFGDQLPYWSNALSLIVEDLYDE